MEILKKILVLHPECPNIIENVWGGCVQIHTEEGSQALIAQTTESNSGQVQKVPARQREGEGEGRVITCYPKLSATHPTIFSQKHETT